MMASYKLNEVLPSPGIHPTFIEFSPNGQFLAIGNRDLTSFYILDRLVGFYPTLSVITPEKPTALIWESSAEFYVGMADGHFTHYRIGPGGKKLMEGVTTYTFCGVFPVLPVTAMALDADSKTLVASVGPEVFASQRIGATSMFHLLLNQGITIN